MEYVRSPATRSHKATQKTNMASADMQWLFYTGKRFAYLSKTAIAYLQMPCNILPVLPQQLGHELDCDVKRSKVILESLFE